MTTLDDYLAAIHAATGYSAGMIESTITDGERGLKPIKLPGSMAWDIWICYKAIRAFENGYERENESFPN